MGGKGSGGKRKGAGRPLKNSTKEANRLDEIAQRLEDVMFMAETGETYMVVCDRLGLKPGSMLYDWLRRNDGDDALKLLARNGPVTLSPITIGYKEDRRRYTTLDKE